MQTKIELVDTSKIRDKKILAVGAHPDDVEFGAGGTLAALSKNNHISFTIATDGRMGTHDDKQKIDLVIKTREEEARKAAGILGIKEVLFYNYPDTELKSYEKNFSQKFLKFLLKLRPDIIFSFDPWGRYEPLIHPCHRVVAWTVIESVLYSTLPLYLKKRGFNVLPLNPKPEIWLFAASEPNTAIEVTKNFPLKLQALTTHQSQFDEVVKFEVMMERVEDRAKVAGEEAGVKLAELFRILR